MIKVRPIWRDNNIPLGAKGKLTHSLAMSLFLYAQKSWILIVELEKRTQVFEMQRYQRLLNISYENRVAEEDVCRKIQAATGEYDKPLALVKKMET